MYVKKYMTDHYYTVSSEKTLKDAVKIMTDNKTNSLLVLDDNKHPIGVISSHLLIEQVLPEYLKNNESVSQFGKKGILAKYIEKNQNKIVKDFMYTNFHILSEEDAMLEAASYLAKGKKRIMPVANKQGALTGIITRTHIKIFINDILFNK